MLKYVGKSVTRYDGIGHVTGGTTYVDDIKIPGMLHIKVFRSPVHKGTIRHLDLTGAEATPGVAAVISAKDVPGINAYGRYPKQPVFPEKYIRYKGERIAAVAAIDEETAMEALERIKIEIEEETPVFDPLEAMKPDAPLVCPEGNLWEFNSGKARKVRLGDVEKGFAEAEYIVEGTYTSGVNVHAPMESSVSIAYIDATDRLTIHTVSQQMFTHLRSLCLILNLPMNKVRLIGGTIGGGFGAKNHINCDHVAGMMALKTRKPVKWRLTRREEMLYTTTRSAWIFEIKDGLKKNGQLIARKIRAIHDMGAYPALGPYIVEKMGSTVAGPYWVPNVWSDGYAVYTNKTPGSSMRGYLMANFSAAIETQMNRIAERIGMDPWELRFINAWRDGDISPSQWEVVSAGLIEVMKKTAEIGGIELPDHLKNMNSNRR
jgi:CO/xanthine dehydrogenase Mo-binding subunit